MAKPKLLLLSFYFPPFNVAGSLRLGKFAKYLEQSGFDVRVITADKQADTQTIPLEIDKDKVIYASWNDVNALPKKFMGGSDKAYEVTQVDKTFLSPKKRFFLFLSNMYKTLTNYPDSRVGWVKGANKAANELFKTWKPDIIYASSLPASVAVAAYKMHKKHTIPWVCEYRDLWTLNHYYYYPEWRRFFEKRLEKRIVKSAEFTVTVSNGLAGQLKDDFGVNAELFINGADFDVLKDIDTAAKDKYLNESDFNIVYTGSLYKGKRTPAVIFEALRNLKAANSLPNTKIYFHFFGKDVGYTQELAKEYGLEEHMRMHGMVPYHEAIKSQMHADLLMLLLWNDASEDGVLTSKLFEYMLAAKPIIAVGRDSNEAIQLINESSLGKSGLEAKDFEQFLLESIRAKSGGSSETINQEEVRQYSREHVSLRMAEIIRNHLNNA